MNFLLGRLADNPAVQACTAQQPFLSASSLTEEALILAASYAQNPRPMLIVKNNLYTAQRLAEKLKSLLSPRFSAWKNRCGWKPSPLRRKPWPRKLKR